MNNEQLAPPSATPWTIEVSVLKAFIVIATAIVGTAISSFVGAIWSLNSNHFATISNTSRIEAIESIVIPRSETESRFDAIDSRLERIENKLDNIYLK